MVLVLTLALLGWYGERERESGEGEQNLFLPVSDVHPADQCQRLNERRLMRCHLNRTNCHRDTETVGDLDLRAVDMTVVPGFKCVSRRALINPSQTCRCNVGK